jgi:hypothetical protein
MAGRLPEDLHQLGDELTSAAGRAVAARRRRAGLWRRLTRTGLPGALVFVALTPAALGPAQRDSGSVRLAAVPGEPVERLGCDQPRGARFTLPACP